MRKSALKIISVFIVLFMFALSFSAISLSVGANNAIPPTRVIDGKTFYELDSAEDYKWFVEFCNSSVDLSGEADVSLENDHDKIYEYYISHNAILTGNIVLNENVLVNGELNSDAASLEQIQPIANYYSADDYQHKYTYTVYNGIFDGNGYVISGFYFNDPESGSSALFGRTTENSVIKNIKLEDTYISGYSSSGGIIVSNKGLISNCTVDGIIHAKSCMIGGIAGSNYGTIENCVNYADVFGEGNAYHLAGIVQSNYGTVRSCVNFGNIGKGTNNQRGGIIWDNDGLVENCMNFGSLTGTGTMGGIIGYAKPNSKIQNCYFNSAVFSGNAIQVNDTQNLSDIVNVKGISSSEIASGEAAFLLGEAYGQKLGVDAYPVFGSNDIVYRTRTYLTCDASDIPSVVYDNDSGQSLDIIPKHTLVGEVTCMGTYCDTCKKYYGEKDVDAHSFYWIDVENGNGLQHRYCEHCGDDLLYKETLCDPTTYPESEHDYPQNAEITYDFESKGALSLKFRFSDNTYTEPKWDLIYLYDADGNEIGEFSGNQLKNAEFTVKGDKFSMKLTSDTSGQKYGFSFDFIYAISYNEEAVCTHEWDEGKVTTEPTCTEKGIKTFTCVHNAQHTYIEDIDIDANAHKWDEGKVTTEPTCTEKGIKTFTCVHNAQHTYIEDIDIDANAHKWDEGKVTTEPTCKDEGTKNFTCTHNSEHTKTEKIVKTEHSYDNACDADCNVCKETRTPAEHSDADSNGVCDVCSYVYPKAEPSETDGDGVTDKTEESTEEKTEEKTDEDKNGCDSAIALSALVTVGIIGTALVIKKKED